MSDGLTVMIVGGTDRIRSTISEGMSRVSHIIARSLSASDVTTAVSILTQQADEIDIIFGCAGPHDTCGFALLRCVRSVNDLKRIPFVVVCEGVDDKDVEVALQYGAAAALVDPVDPEQVASCIERRGRKGRRSASGVWRLEDDVVNTIRRLTRPEDAAEEVDPSWEATPSMRAARTDSKRLKRCFPVARKPDPT